MLLVYFGKLMSNYSFRNKPTLMVRGSTASWIWNSFTRKWKMQMYTKTMRLFWLLLPGFYEKKIRTGRDLPKKKHKKLVWKYTETSFSEILGELLPVFTIEIPLRVEIYQNMSCKCPFYNSRLCGKTIII